MPRERRKKARGAGTGGHDGYMAYFRRALAELTTSRGEIISPSAEFAKELGVKWAGLSEREKRKWRGSSKSMFEVTPAAVSAGSQLLAQGSSGETALFNVFLASIR
jgi:hypothetical protein